MRQNSELLRALDELEKTCTTLREENGLLVRLKITDFVVLTEGFLESRPGAQKRCKKQNNEIVRFSLFQLGAVTCSVFSFHSNLFSI